MKVLEVPAKIARLPKDARGFHVPWFVAEVDGEPDFRVIKSDGIIDALRFDLCWVCGTPRGRTAAFVIGPMCAVNRVSSEPPSHLDCAIYSARACPFLTKPGKPRREAGLPEHCQAAGIGITRNPGVALVWSSRTWKPFSVPSYVGVPARRGILMDVGEPLEVRWFAEGREATRAEVLASIETGLPLLQEQAEKDGTAALAELSRMTERAMLLVPA